MLSDLTPFCRFEIRQKNKDRDHVDTILNTPMDEIWEMLRAGDVILGQLLEVSRANQKNLYSGAYGQWLSIQKAIRKAGAEAEADSDCYIPPQTTWVDEKELTERFICEVASLIRVHEIFCETLDNEENERRNWDNHASVPSSLFIAVHLLGIPQGELINRPVQFFSQSDLQCEFPSCIFGSTLLFCNTTLFRRQSSCP